MIFSTIIFSDFILFNRNIERNKNRVKRKCKRQTHTHVMLMHHLNFIKLQCKIIQVHRRLFCHFFGISFFFFFCVNRRGDNATQENDHYSVHDGIVRLINSFLDFFCSRSFFRKMIFRKL